MLVTELTSATPPAMIMPRADPETAFTEAAPVTCAIGLLVGDGGIFTPVDATVLGRVLASGISSTMTIYIRRSSDGGHDGKESDDVEFHLDGFVWFWNWLREGGWIRTLNWKWLF